MQGGRTTQEGAPIRNPAENNTHASTERSHAAPDVRLRSPTPQGRAEKGRGIKRRRARPAAAHGHRDTSQASQLQSSSSKTTDARTDRTTHRQTKSGDRLHKADAAARTHAPQPARPDRAPTHRSSSTHARTAAAARTQRCQHELTLHRPARRPSSSTHARTAAAARTNCSQDEQTVHRPDRRHNVTTR